MRLQLSREGKAFVEREAGKSRENSPARSIWIAIFKTSPATLSIMRSSQPWLSLPIPVRFNGASHRVLMHVSPDDNTDGRAVVLFIEGRAVERITKGQQAESWILQTRNGQPLLTVIWRERGGPKTTEPETKGFGSQLIDRAIPNATVRREFAAGGVICTIDVRLPKALGASL